MVDDELTRLRRALDLAEARLRTEREKYRLLIEQSNAPFSAVSRDGVYLAISRGSASRLKAGAEVADILGHNVREFIAPEAAQTYLETIEEVCASGQGKSYERAVTFPTRGTRWYWHDIQPFFDELGQAVGVHMIAYDTTHLHEIEQKLQASLRDKDLLLREMHHRVKNNLQVVSSLLSLQAGERDKSAERKLRESAERVRLIARIHERLYTSENPGRVDFRDLASDLVRDAITCFDTTHSVRPELDIPSVHFTTEMAVPAGLVLHELVRKALEHGFAGWPGALVVKIARDEQGSLVLTVRDPGHDAAQRFDEKDMSISLVRALVAQLGAQLELDTSTGTCVTVRFAPHVAPENELPT